MGQIIIEKFYLFFQGIIIFQVLFFGIIYSLTKRKEILYYCLFLWMQILYFFINAPQTFFNIPDDLVFNSKLYLIVNYFLILIGNLFYLLFIRLIFRQENNIGPMADKLFIGSIYALPVLFLFFISFPIFNWPRTIIFYIGILISLPVSIYLIYINYISAKNIQHLIIKGIICNIVGVIITVLMIERYNQGIREYAFDDYPLLYMRIGILAEVFFYQLAILRKWNEQEQLLATKDIQNKLEISNVKNQISRELHDDVGTTLSKINLQSFMAQNKIKEENFNIVDTLKAIQNESQELIQRIKNLIWTVDEATQDFNLIKKVEEYGKAMCDSKDIQFNIFKDSNMVENLGIENKYNLLMICREAINNSVKYSQASTLQIKFFETEDHLMVSVNDNGIGLKNINSGEGLGLTNMKHRAMQLNGTISFITRNGFEVNLSIPL